MTLGVDERVADGLGLSVDVAVDVRLGDGVTVGEGVRVGVELGVGTQALLVCSTKLSK